MTKARALDERSGNPVSTVLFMKMICMLGALLALMLTGCATKLEVAWVGTVVNSSGGFVTAAGAKQPVLDYGTLKMTQVVFRQELRQGTYAKVYANGAHVATMKPSDGPFKYRANFIGYNIRNILFSVEIFDKEDQRIAGYDRSIDIYPIDTSFYENGNGSGRGYNYNEMDILLVHE
jgi:hypothetical protein